MGLLITYGLRSGWRIDHRSDEGTVQEAVDLHEEIFGLGPDARITMDTDGGKRIIPLAAIDFIEIREVDGGG